MVKLPSSSGAGKYEVTPLELFFDLVFAFAVSQLSSHLVENLSWRGAGETIVLLLAVLTVWAFTSWAATMFRVECAPSRWMVLSVTWLGLFMNAAISGAFKSSGWAFLIPMLVIQLGRTVWTIAYATEPVYRDHYIRLLVWLLATTPLWLAGARVNSESRLLWWSLAAGIELIATWLAHPLPGRWLKSENVEFDADHMLERCRLFLLIALGETVLNTGTAIASTPLTAITVLTGTAALAAAVAFWALFASSHRLVGVHIEHTSDPIRASRYAVNVLMVMVAGLITVAVGNRIVIDAPLAPSSPVLSLLLFGGSILVLLAKAWYSRMVLNASTRAPLIGSASMGVAAVITLTMPSCVALTTLGGMLVVIAWLDKQ